MTLQEAKAKYEANGGHYFEWFDFFGQFIASELFESKMTFVVGAHLKKSGGTRYSVLGFDDEFKHVLGYGDIKGYSTLEEAVKKAKRPGKAKW